MPGSSMEKTGMSARVTWPAVIGGYSQTFAVCDGRQAVIEIWRVVLDPDETEHDGGAGLLEPWPIYIAGGSASMVRTRNYTDGRPA